MGKESTEKFSFYRFLGSHAVSPEHTAAAAALRRLGHRKWKVKTIDSMADLLNCAALIPAEDMPACCELWCEFCNYADRPIE